jgi:glycopeptide antibiotics resistance protein
LKRYLPFAGWTLVILALCSMPGKAIPQISWLELLSFDKLVHAGIFFVEQLLLMRIVARAYRWLAFSFTVAYGGLLELMQYYVFSERSGDVLDFMANATGALVGLLLYRKLSKKLDFLPA